MGQRTGEPPTCLPSCPPAASCMPVGKHTTQLRTTHAHAAPPLINVLPASLNMSAGNSHIPAVLHHRPRAR